MSIINMSKSFLWTGKALKNKIHAVTHSSPKVIPLFPQHRRQKNVAAADFEFSSLANSWMRKGSFGMAIQDENGGSGCYSVII